MEITKIKKNIQQKLAIQPAAFFNSSLVLFALIIAARILFEFFNVWGKSAAVHITALMIIQSLLLDLLFLFYLSFLLGIIFFLLSLVNTLAAKLFYYFIAVFIVISYIILEIYFLNTSIPLGSDLFAYSFQEILHTVKAAGGINIFQTAGLIVVSVITVLILRYFSKFKINNNFIDLFLILCVLSFIFYRDIIPSNDEFNSLAEYHLVVNKLDYFGEKTYEYFTQTEDEYLKAEYYYDTDIADTNTFKYINSNYPFLHEETAEDVLSSFFKHPGKKPSFVFLIIESLGRAYSGKGAYFGSFTPFLDSLAQESLYWENMLSTGGRTFAVFPAIFGSLPFAKKGFLDLGNSMPDHFSLISFLKSYGYTAKFFHGGDAHFDNMDLFFRKNKTDFILSEKNFGPGYSKMPSDGNGFSWGYGDKEVFAKSFEIIKNDHGSQINIYMSLSTHSPFRVANQDYYKKLVDDIIKKHNIDNNLKKEVLLYKDIISTILYMDDAVRNFFVEYKKRDDFNNTIFIITGDHRMPEIPILNQIDRFHVPLLIYSPLLKRTARFASISSHFDILPSILAYLKNSHQMTVPSSSVFLGSGLDTARYFRNIHSYPLMRNKNELLDYIDKDYFVSDGTLYRINQELNIIKISDEVMLSRINNLFDDFKNKNNNLARTKILQPDL